METEKVKPLIIRAFNAAKGVLETESKQKDSVIRKLNREIEKRDRWIESLKEGKARYEDRIRELESLINAEHEKLISEQYKNEILTRTYQTMEECLKKLSAEEEVE